MNPIDLAELFALDDEAFAHDFATRRCGEPKRRGLLRNAAIVLGNRPHAPAIAALIRGLNDAEPLVRGACAWALRQYSAPSAAAALARGEPSRATRKCCARSGRFDERHSDQRRGVRVFACSGINFRL